MGIMEKQLELFHIEKKLRKKTEVAMPKLMLMNEHYSKQESILIEDRICGKPNTVNHRKSL